MTTTVPSGHDLTSLRTLESCLAAAASPLPRKTNTVPAMALRARLTRLRGALVAPPTIDAADPDASMSGTASSSRNATPAEADGAVPAPRGRETLTVDAPTLPPDTSPCMGATDGDS